MTVEGVELTLKRLAAKLRSGTVTMASLRDGTGVVLSCDDLAVLNLNETGMFLVQLIAVGQLSAEALAEALSREFAVDPSKAHSDVHGFIGELSRAFEGPA